MAKLTGKRTLNRKGVPVSKNVRAYVNKKLKNSNELKMNSKQMLSVITSGGWQEFKTPGYDHLNGCKEGDASSERDGIKVRQRNVRLAMTVSLPNDRPQSMRVIILERKSNFTIGAGGDLPDVSNGLTAPFTLESKAKFNILHDKIYSFTPHRGDSGLLDRLVYRVINIPLKNKNLTFTGSSEADLQNGRILCYVVADALPSGSGWITLNGNCDFYFRDK